MVQRKKIFITGGTGSIGRALVRQFSEVGDVTFQFASAVEAASRIETEFGATAVAIDFAQDGALPVSQFDVLVNNAAINISRDPAHCVRLDDWNRTIAVNLTFPFRVVRQYLPEMIEKRWGRIVNISSIYGLRASENNLPYTVSKHGLSGLTKSVAREVGSLGITCNEICPGPVDSELIKRIAIDNSEATGEDPVAYLKELADEIPVGRLARPDEVARLAVFLASDAAAYVNGVSIPLDGGLIS